MSHGATMEEAAHNILDAAEGWLATAAKHGDHIPAPPKSASGKLVVRMPKDLHAQVAERASREGVSLNTWIVTAIARSNG
jgi:antitoxin HicB